MKPQVSVVVPFLSGLEDLSRAVASAFDSKLRVEVIVSVDSKSDSSREDIIGLLRGELNEKALALLRVHSCPYPGASAARNLGIAVSEGEYISFLDADDYFLPGKLDYQVESMTRYSLVFSYHHHLIRVGSNYSRVRASTHLTARKLAFGIARVASASVCISRAALDVGSLFPEEELGEDFAGWLKVLAKHAPSRCKLLDFYGAVVQVNTNSARSKLTRLPLRSLWNRSWGASNFLGSVGIQNGLKKPRLFKFRLLVRGAVIFASLLRHSLQKSKA